MQVVMENLEGMEKKEREGNCGMKRGESRRSLLRERDGESGDCESERERKKPHRRMEKDGGGGGGGGGGGNNNPSRGREGRRKGGYNNQDGITRSNGYQSCSTLNGSQTTVDEKEKKQRCTIFVGDLDSATTPYELTSLFEKFGKVLSSKIKDDLCYGFVTFNTRECAEAAVAAGQREGGITLPNNKKQIHVSWALGALPDWKKGIGGFVISPSKSQPIPRSRKGVVKSSVLAAATAAAAAKAHAVLAGADVPPPTLDQPVFRGREIIAYDDLL